MRGIDRTAGLHSDVYSDRGPVETRDNCVFHDWLPESEVQQVLRQAKVLLLPSRAEAFPIILLEAAACGTPFVAARTAGVEDIAEESGAGCCTTSATSQAMRGHRPAYRGPASLEELSRNGRQWVESLSLSEIVHRWQRPYAELGVQIAVDSTQAERHG